MRARSRILLRDAATTAVVVAVLSGLVLGGMRLAAYVRHQGVRPAPTERRHGTAARPAKSATSRKVAPTGPSSPGPTPPALGVYTGPGATAATESLDSSLGGKIGYALDFQPAATWTALSDPSWLAHSWASSPFTLVIAVPMLPTSGGTLATGATGAYDGAFALLAQRLVADGLGRSVLMIGWQPESNQYPWQVSSPSQAVAYVQFWDHIHDAMAAVPGAQFQFEWDAGLPTGQLTPGQLYPGDADVNIIGVDAFDVGSAIAGVSSIDQWTALVTQPYGPSWAASFAAAHGKRLAFGMCGLVPATAGGGGDNPSFLTDSVRWADTAHVSIYMLWDYGSWSITGGAFPQGDSALTRALGLDWLGGPVSVTAGT